MRSREQDLPGRFVTIHGAVNSDGTIRLIGSGDWRVVKEGVGVYAIHPFQKVAQQGADMDALALTADRRVYTDRPAAAWRAVIHTSAGALTDTAFSFSVKARLI